MHSFESRYKQGLLIGGNSSLLLAQLLLSFRDYKHSYIDENDEFTLAQIYYRLDNETQNLVSEMFSMSCHDPRVKSLEELSKKDFKLAVMLSFRIKMNYSLTKSEYQLLLRLVNSRRKQSKKVFDKHDNCF